MVDRPNSSRLAKAVVKFLLGTWTVSALIAAVVVAVQSARNEITVHFTDWLAAIVTATLVALAWFAPPKRIIRLTLCLSAIGLVVATAALADPRFIAVVLLGALTTAVLALNHLQLMTAVGSTSLLVVALLAFELPLLAPAPALIEWGQPASFAYLFPETPPLVGPGGRLRPRLNARMVHPDRRNGVRLITNAAGFRNETNPPLKKPPGEFRVLNLGDSFSIGYRIDQDDFFGSVLQREWRRRLPSKNITVLNAEISDPATGLNYLQQAGFKYEPDLVVYGLCGNDVMQAYSFTGAGRKFALVDGRITWKSPNDEPRIDARQGWPDIVYSTPCEAAIAPSNPAATSRFKKLELARRLTRWHRRFTKPGEVTTSWIDPDRPRQAPLIDGFPNLGFYHRASSPIVDPMYATCFAVLAAMRDQCRQSGSELVIVVHPQRFTVQPQDWQAQQAAWCLNPADFDLSAMSRRIKQWCDQAGVPCLDLTGAFRTAARKEQLYLPAGDVHYNEAGHLLAGQTTAKFLAQRHLGGEI